MFSSISLVVALRIMTDDFKNGIRSAHHDLTTFLVENEDEMEYTPTEGVPEGVLERELDVMLQNRRKTSIDDKRKRRKR